MDLRSVRVRYLVAMGLVADGATTVGCKDDPPIHAEADPQAKSRSKEPRATTSATAVPVATASVVDESVGPIGGRRMPSCPHGTFCVPPPPSVTTMTAAPAPYAMCAQTAVDPSDPPPPPPTGDAGSWRPPRHIVNFDPAATKEARDAGKATDCCYHWVMPCPGGRALIVDGEPRTTHTKPRDDWSRSIVISSAESLDGETRERLAAHWLAEAGAEHASVASFARTSLALMALGAPATLVRETHEAAIDEVRHAEACYAIASAYVGAPRGPAPIDATSMATPEITAFAIETLHAACIGETIAALVAKSAAARATQPAIARVLEAIGDDEDRHAMLAWRTLAWAIEAGGEPTKLAIALEIEAIFSSSSSSSSSSHGLLSLSEHHAIRSSALREIVVPCARALLASRLA